VDKSSKDVQDEHTRKYRELILSQQTLLLSTVTVEGEPECSYAPYVRDQHGVFYIYVSELAAHTRNMLQKGCASVLFIRPEKEVKNIFARERVVFKCLVNEVQNSDERYDKQLLKMKDKFGETIELLRSLSDFHLLALTPLNGKYIAGFGQAYTIDLTSDRVDVK
jgi:putative heme iron utilization protein